MVDYYLGRGRQEVWLVEKGILTPDLVERIRADVENASDSCVCDRQERIMVREWTREVVSIQVS